MEKKPLQGKSTLGCTSTIAIYILIFQLLVFLFWLLAAHYWTLQEKTTRHVNCNFAFISRRLVVLLDERFGFLHVDSLSLRIAGEKEKKEEWAALLADRVSSSMFCATSW